MPSPCVGLEYFAVMLHAALLASLGSAKTSTFLEKLSRLHF